MYIYIYSTYIHNGIDMQNCCRKVQWSMHSAALLEIKKNMLFNQHATKMLQSASKIFHRVRSRILKEICNRWKMQDNL